MHFVLEASLTVFLAPWNFQYILIKKLLLAFVWIKVFFFPDRSGTLQPPTQEQIVPIPNNGPPTWTFKISAIMRLCSLFMFVTNWSLFLSNDK